MSKKKSRSVFNLEREKISFNDYFKKKFPLYHIYLPKDDHYPTNPNFTDSSIFKCLDYAYGVGEFMITSDSGFQFIFNPNNYSDKDVKKCGYLEPFDFLTHNILTDYELDVWKKYIRGEDMC